MHPLQNLCPQCKVRTVWVTLYFSLHIRHVSLHNAWPVEVTVVEGMVLNTASGIGTANSAACRSSCSSTS
jgi:hypothetical protein